MTISTAKVYCPYCGNRNERRFLDGTERAFCLLCDRILYENPIPATCVVACQKGRILLVKRKFPPKANEWCLPGGFMELAEQPETAALRELAEETGLKGKVTGFLGAMATPGIIYNGLLILGFTVEIIAGEPVPGDDASEAAWFKKDRVPKLAFSSHAEFIIRAGAKGPRPHDGYLRYP